MKKASNRMLSLARCSVIAVGMSVLPVTAWAETLTDALIAAYRNSNLLEQNRALLRVADDDVAVAMSSLRPTLDFVARASSSDPLTDAARFNNVDNVIGTFQLQASMVLYAGGRNKLSVESAKEAVLATRESLRRVEQSVLLSAVQAYMNVLASEANVTILENNVQLISQELKAAQDRFDVGEVTRTDVAQAESRLAAARSELAANRGDFAVAREIYKTAVGNYPGDLQTPGALPATANSLKEAQDIAVRTHPSIREAQRLVTVSEIGLRIAEAGYLPSVSASVSAQTETNTNFEERTLNLDYTQPIYRGGQLAAFERQAINNVRQNRSNLLQTTLQIEENAASAYAQLLVSRAQIEATNQQINAAQIAFDGTREEAQLGARTTLDVLDAEQELLDARAARIQATATQYVANYSLLSAMGLLNVEHLQLGIQTYDPAGYYNSVRNGPASLSKQGRKLDNVLRRLGK